MKMRRNLLAFICVAAVLTIAAVAPFLQRAGAQNVAATGSSASTNTRSSSDPKIVYPESKKVDQVDDYFGTAQASLRFLVAYITISAKFDPACGDTT